MGSNEVLFQKYVEKMSDFFLAWTKFTALNQYWWFGCWWWCWIMRSELPSANRIESATCFKAGHSHFNASLCILKQSLHLKNDWQKTRWGKKSKPVKNLLNTVSRKRTIRKWKICSALSQRSRMNLINCFKNYEWRFKMIQVVNMKQKYDTKDRSNRSKRAMRKYNRISLYSFEGFRSHKTTQFLSMKPKYLSLA